MPAKARPKKNLSAMKRTRQNVKRNIRNRSVMSGVKTLLKKVESAVESGSRDDAVKTLLEAVSALDRAASKGVIHKNTASRNVSRLTKKVNGLSSQAEAPATGAA